MDKQKIETAVSEIFMANLAELKAGKQVDMSFYLFFADGFWKLPENNCEKDVQYAVVNILVDAFKPEAYCLVSDTNVRDPHTNEIMYEQLIACVVGKDGVGQTIFRPYDRLPNGKIKLTRPQHSMDEAMLSGIATALYDPPPALFLAEHQAWFIDAHKKMIDDQKIPYRDYVQPGAEKPGEEKSVSSKSSGSRHSPDDGPGIH